MKKRWRILVPALTGFLLLACSMTHVFSNAADMPPALTAAPTLMMPSATLPPAQQKTAGLLETVEMNPCTLLTAAEAEAIMAEVANPPANVNGACVFTNAKDALYMVSIAAAQGRQAEGILQGQAMLLGFAGGQLDEARMKKLQELAAARDYRAYFSELVAAAESAPTLKARLVEGTGLDLAYWTWIAADPRRQGGLVMVSGPTLINLNMVVSDTQSEDAMLAASSALVKKAFGLLPLVFTIAMPTATPPQPAAPPTPTLIGGANEGPPANPSAAPTAVPTAIPPQPAAPPTPTLVGGAGENPPAGPTAIPTSVPTAVPTAVPAAGLPSYPRQMKPG